MADIDHLVFSRITIKPDNAELISIKNPTNESINLNNYYISDSPNYYKIQTEANLSPGNPINDFLVKFPSSTSINSGDSILISIQPEYKLYYGEDFEVDFSLVGNNLIETEPGSAGNPANSGRFNDTQESLILFYWDGSESSPVKDVDYFLWGGSSQAVDKSSVLGYSDDSLAEEQEYLPVHDTNYTFTRKSIVENELENGNGISGHDETSESLNSTWSSEPAPEFIFGCMDNNADNYNPVATIDNGSCTDSFYEVLTNCLEQEVSCQGQYDLPVNNTCPLYGQKVTLTGTVVDFYDITPSNGPFSFKIEDEKGYRISFVVWKNSSSYQDGFNILQSSLVGITKPPFNQFIVKITGSLGVYCRSAKDLNIYSDWQVLVENESDIEILEVLEKSGDFLASDIEDISISPSPFVIIPSLGETLDFSFTVLDKTRAIVRIFDLSGRFITSLVDDYYEYSGKISHEEGLAPWDGRDQLGQIVSPGTYIMHLEVFNPVTGETRTKAAPIVVGAKD